MKITMNDRLYNPNFGDIRQCRILGMAARRHGFQKYVENAFQNNEVLQNYCKKNDVIVNYITNPDGFLYYSAMHIVNTLPRKPKNILEKVISLFKKSHDTIYIKSGNELEAFLAERHLADKINDIKTEADLLKYKGKGRG